MNRNFKKLAIISLAGMAFLVGPDLSQAAGGAGKGRSASQGYCTGQRPRSGSGNQYRNSQGGSYSTTGQGMGRRYGDGTRPQPKDGTGFGAKARSAGASN